MNTTTHARSSSSSSKSRAALAAGPVPKRLTSPAYQGLHVERVTHPRIAALELWDLVLTDGRTLFEARDDARFPELLGSAVKALREGTARTKSGAPIDPRVREVRSVVLHGGRVENVADVYSRVSATAGIPVRRLEGLARSGQAVAGVRRGVVPVVDLGQTAAKVFARDGGLRFPRDWESLPHADNAPRDAEKLASIRGSWVHFAEMALRWALRYEGGTDEVVGLVWALPCALDSEGVPGASSYAGVEGRADLLRQAIERSALWETRVMLVNDAELAAHAAIADPATSRTQRTLVLTAGYGVGGALVLGSKE